MNTVDEKLSKIAEDLQAGESPPSHTVREFLSWIGAQRRGVWIVAQLRDSLEKFGVVTEPDFESAFIDSSIKFKLLAGSEEIDDTAEDQSAAAKSEVSAEEPQIPDAFKDPTYRLSKLAAANKPPISVKPDETLEVAITRMLANDFSQLPVMTNDRDVKGVISWKSVGTRLATGQPIGKTASDYMDGQVEIVGRDSSLFTVIGQIVEHDFVLVRAKDRIITGIVTASDLSAQFRTLTEPFLLLSEIENQVRRIISARFKNADLQKAVDPADPARKISSVADLTFGEYIRLLQNPDQWAKLKVSIDRKIFVEKLDQVRQIRNDVMHFDPDGIPPSDLESLRDFSKLLQTLEAIGAF